MQSLIKAISMNNLFIISKTYHENFHYLSTNFYGSRVVQQFLRRIKNQPKILYIFSKLVKENFFFLATNVYSMHVVKTFLEICSTEDFQFGFDVFFTNVVYFASNNYSCYLFDIILSRSNFVNRRLMVINILKFFYNLIMNNSSCNLIVKIIDFQDLEYNNFITFSLCDRLEYFIQCKFASKVVRHCFKSLDINNKILLSKSFKAKGLVQYALFNVVGVEGLIFLF